VLATQKGPRHDSGSQLALQPAPAGNGAGTTTEHEYEHEGGDD
jgi:hypothetical protein